MILLRMCLVNVLGPYGAVQSVNNEQRQSQEVVDTTRDDTRHQLETLGLAAVAQQLAVVAALDGMPIRITYSIIYC